MRNLKTVIASAILATTATAQVPPPGAPVPSPANSNTESASFSQGPRWLGQRYLSGGDYRELDDLVADLVKKKARNDDGRFELSMMEEGIEEFIDLFRSSGDAFMTSRLESWQSDFPDSAYRPIVAAINLNSAALHARGHGFSSTVTDEGWKLFHERSRRAWIILMDSKKASSSIPSWYSNAISIGFSAEVSGAELRELFDEGITRHPGYSPIYFAYLQEFAPRWGGTFAAADKFIREQVAAKTNTDGEVLYARLYWSLDQYGGQQPDLFTDSMVSWPRMRKAFEQMMREYPHSDWNLANFASFACRARDATSYGKLRAKVNPLRFEEASPEGISLDVCDTRFMKST